MPAMPGGGYFGPTTLRTAIVTLLICSALLGAGACFWVYVARSFVP